jgi:hypothetical protein
MKTAKNTIVVLLIVISLLSLFVGCRQPNNNPSKKDYEKMTAYVSVHFLIDNNQYHYTVQEIETDNYGRTLYSVLLNTDVKYKQFVVIMQGFSKNCVWFYEDVSYYIGEETNEETSMLKELNDWNSPLNEEKITKRNVHIEFPPGEGIYFGGTLKESKSSNPSTEWSKFVSDICSQLSINKDLYNIYITDFNGINKWLLYISSKETGDIDYFVISDEKCVLSTVLCNDIESIQQEITNIKMSCNWNE